MRFIVNSIVLAALFVAPLAQAQEKPLPFRSNEEIQVDALQEDRERAGRVFAEILGGGLGAAGGGVAGLFMGAAGGTSQSAGLGALGGLAVGAWGGTMIGGTLAGGNGNVGATLLGTLAGSLVSIFVIPAAAQSGSSVLVLGAALALPLTGAIIGYEVSYGPRVAAPPSGYSLRFMSTVSLAADGKGVTAGVTGTF